MFLEIVRLTHLSRLLTVLVVPYSTGIDLVIHDGLLESLRSKNAVKMMHGTKDLAIKIFGGGLLTLWEIAVTTETLDVTENQGLTPKTI